MSATHLSPYHLFLYCRRNQWWELSSWAKVLFFWAWWQRHCYRVTLKEKKKYEEWNKYPNLLLSLNVEFSWYKRKYEGEILVAFCGPVVVSSIHFRLYTEMEQRNVERTRRNGTRWNAIPPWLLSNVNDHTGVYREKLVYHITKRTEYFLNNVHRTYNHFWLINKSLKYSILLIKH